MSTRAIFTEGVGLYVVHFAAELILGLQVRRLNKQERRRGQNHTRLNPWCCGLPLQYEPPESALVEKPVAEENDICWCRIVAAPLPCVLQYARELAISSCMVVPVSFFPIFAEQFCVVARACAPSAQSREKRRKTRGDAVTPRVDV